MTRGEFAKGPMGVFKFAQTSEIDANLQGKYPHKMSAKFEGKTFWLRAGLPYLDGQTNNLDGKRIIWMEKDDNYDGNTTIMMETRKTGHFRPYFSFISGF